MASIVGALVVVAVRAHSSSAFEAGGALGSRVRVGEAHSYGIGSASRDVDIDRVIVRFAPGSARAATEVSICRQAAASEQMGVVIEWDTARSCDPLVAATGGRLHHGDLGLGAEYLVLTVVPLEPGTVVVAAVNVHYRSGGHTRTDATGPRVELTVQDG